MTWRRHDHGPPPRFRARAGAGGGPATGRTGHQRPRSAFAADTVLSPSRSQCPRGTAGPPEYTCSTAFKRADSSYSTASDPPWCGVWRKYHSCQGRACSGSSCGSCPWPVWAPTSSARPLSRPMSTNGPCAGRLRWRTNPGMSSDQTLMPGSGSSEISPPNCLRTGSVIHCQHWPLGVSHGPRPTLPAA